MIWFIKMTFFDWQLQLGNNAVDCSDQNYSNAITVQSWPTALPPSTRIQGGERNRTDWYVNKTSHWSRERILNSNGRNRFNSVCGGVAGGSLVFVLPFKNCLENRSIAYFSLAVGSPIQVYTYPIVVSAMLYANNCVAFSGLLRTRSSSYEEFCAPRFYRTSTEIIKSERFTTILMHVSSHPYPVIRNCRI